MKVLVAGASGFLGLSAVRAMAAVGHEVVGLVRTAQKGEVVAAAGGRPVVGDVLQISTLLAASEGCEALVHLAASADGAQRDLGPSQAAKVRVDGAYNLVAAARKTKVPRLIIGSGTWLHGDHKEPITETSRVDPYGTSMFNWQAERAALGANKPGELDIVVLRPGMVYGNGGWFKEMVDEIQAQTYRVPGDGANYWSPLHIDDCGEALRVVLENGKSGEVYLVADDEPVRLRALVDLIADELPVARPPAETIAEAAKRLGEPTARHLAATQVVRNAKIRALGWSPHVPSSRAGIRAVLLEMRKYGMGGTSSRLGDPSPSADRKDGGTRA